MARHPLFDTQRAVPEEVGHLSPCDFQIFHRQDSGTFPPIFSFTCPTLLAHLPLPIPLLHILRQNQADGAEGVHLPHPHLHLHPLPRPITCRPVPLSLPSDRGGEGCRGLDEDEDGVEAASFWAAPRFPAFT